MILVVPPSNFVLVLCHWESPPFFILTAAALNWAVPMCTVAQPRHANTTSPDGRTGVGQGPAEQSGSGCHDISNEAASSGSSGLREDNSAIYYNSASVCVCAWAEWHNNSPQTQTNE